MCRYMPGAILLKVEVITKGGAYEKTLEGLPPLLNVVCRPHSQRGQHKARRPMLMLIASLSLVNGPPLDL